MEKLVFVISGNYNVLYVNECKIKSLYIFTITTKLLYKLDTSTVPFAVTETTEQLELPWYFYLTLSHSVAMNKKLLLKNCYLTVNKAGNPYVLDPDVSVSVT